MITAGNFMFWVPFLIAMAVSAAVTPLAIKIAPKIGAMDVPKDGRRMHTKVMPRFGGLAIYAGIMVSLLIFSDGERGIISAMVGCTITYAFGVLDDLINLKALAKLIGQVFCATVVFAMGLRVEFLTNYFGFGNFALSEGMCYIITVLWLVSITNAVNLIDGLDGLAAGVSAISALCIAYVAYIHGQYVTTMAVMVVAGAALGFLPYNFHPAKTFMGDGGSQLLGFAIAAFSILGTVKSATIVILVIPAIVLGLPIFDTIMAIVRRTMRHQSIGTPDKEHLHHRIVKAGFGQRRAVMLMYCISGLMGIIAVLYSRGYVVEYLGLIAIVVMLLYVLISDTGNRNVSINAERIVREKNSSNTDGNDSDEGE